MLDGVVGITVHTDGYEAIVYDLDGTLVDLRVDWDAARRDVFAVLRAREVEVTESMDLWDMLTAAEESGFTQAIEVKLGEHEREGAWDAGKLPLADELPHDVPVGICSLNCEDACRLALELHGIDGYVDAIVGRDSHDARKPDPEPLLAVIDELGAEPQSTLFVGDSESDATAAEQAGVDFQWVDALLDVAD